MKILVSFFSYPRNNIDTYNLFKNTFNSLMNDNLTNIELKFLIVGDDYENIKCLEPILEGYNYEFYNININDALRNKNIDKEIKWKHAVTRSIIFAFEKALETDYDYIFISADDELYINNKLSKSITYIQNYNYPDFVYSLGYHYKNIIPKKYDKNNLQNNYPLSCNVIESGTMYKLSNKKFIQNIIDFRKSRWTYIQNNIDKNKNKFHIEPEDAELWVYLLPFFQNKTYTSVLIPEVLVDHFTEKSIFKYI